MKSITLIGLLLIAPLALFAQFAVSGFVNQKIPSDSTLQLDLYEVHLFNNDEQLVTSAHVQMDGIFNFEKSHFESNDRIYRLQLRGENSDRSQQQFILSDKDSICYEYGNTFLVGGGNSSAADAAWHRLRGLETYYDKQMIAVSNQNYRDYVRDSIQILLVKLIGIQTLRNRDLLEVDIKANLPYYQQLLRELKKSEIENQEYAYLDRLCAVIAEQNTASKYHLSLLFNVLISCLFLLLGFRYWKTMNKSSSPAIISLSKQESKIKSLIVAGKSNKEIASELFISISTVKTHITNIYSKLGVSGRKELLS